jgi:hypothetical protein
LSVASSLQGSQAGVDLAMLPTKDFRTRAKNSFQFSVFSCLQGGQAGDDLAMLPSGGQPRDWFVRVSGRSATHLLCTRARNDVR